MDWPVVVVVVAIIGVAVFVYHLDMSGGRKLPNKAALVGMGIGVVLGLWLAQAKLSSFETWCLQSKQADYGTCRGAFGWYPPWK